MLCKSTAFQGFGYLLTSLMEDQFAFSTRQWEMEKYLSVFVTNEAKNTQIKTTERFPSF